MARTNSYRKQIDFLIVEDIAEPGKFSVFHPDSSKTGKMATKKIIQTQTVSMPEVTSMHDVANLIKDASLSQQLAQEFVLSLVSQQLNSDLPGITESHRPLSDFGFNLAVKLDASTIINKRKVIGQTASASGKLSKEQIRARKEEMRKEYKSNKELQLSPAQIQALRHMKEEEEEAAKEKAKTEPPLTLATEPPLTLATVLAGLTPSKKPSISTQQTAVSSKKVK